MKDVGRITVTEPDETGGDIRSVEVRVPASTSNLGSGFDCCGLALRLYLTVRAVVRPASSEPCRVRTRGAGAGASLPRSEENLIYRAMRFIADQESLRLPPVRLAVRNEIPLASGLGSSGAAVVAGAALCAALSDHQLSAPALLRYGTKLEGHSDNVAAALYGGWVVNCITEGGGVIAVKRRWPRDIKLVVVTPHAPLETKVARALLPPTVSHVDAVFNLQRAVMFGAALEAGNYDLLWEAMRDRLHQPHRAPLVPGLAEALATPQLDGLLGLALSGSGPSVVALAQSNFDEIGAALARGFHQHGIETAARLLEVEDEGLRVAKR
ncbi:MAG: homoserine kinase [Acidobacteriota bacterium]|nr:homoserine kinase [Acidobacteriota bacterium]